MTHEQREKLACEIAEVIREARRLYSALDVLDIQARGILNVRTYQSHPLRKKTAAALALFNGPGAPLSFSEFMDALQEK